MMIRLTGLYYMEMRLMIKLYKIDKSLGMSV